MNRVCKDCKTDKPLTEFYHYQKRPASYCKPCHNKRTKPDGAYPRRTGRSGYMKKYFGVPSNLIKRKVRLQAQNAVKKGILKSMPCVECGNTKSEMHHEDYSQPLNVMWLCKKCHTKKHLNQYTNGGGRDENLRSQIQGNG